MASDRDCVLNKQELEFQMEHKKSAAALTNPYASANEESVRAISNYASNDHATTANAKPGPA